MNFVKNIKKGGQFCLPFYIIEYIPFNSKLKPYHPKLRYKSSFFKSTLMHNLDTNNHKQELDFY